MIDGQTILQFILRNLDEMARGGLIRLRIVTSEVMEASNAALGFTKCGQLLG